MSLNVIFMGTPDFAVPTLARIIDAGHKVIAVYSQPPRPAGRGMARRLTAVHRFAERSGIEVFSPKSLKEPEEQTRFDAFDCDVAVIVAYGLILPRSILDAPRLGCFNLHASLLPRWRGAAPIQRAIMAGDEKTGVMVMRMEEGLDTGPICRSEPVDIHPDMTAGTLHDALAETGSGLIASALKDLELGVLTCEAQDETGVSYAKKIEKSEARIVWSRSASEVHNHIRGLSPFPGAWCEMARDGKIQRVKILNSEIIAQSGNIGVPGEVLDDQVTLACGEGSIRLTCLQRAGKKAMDTAEFVRGWPLKRGDRFA